MYLPSLLILDDDCFKEPKAFEAIEAIEEFDTEFSSSDMRISSSSELEKNSERLSSIFLIYSIKA